MLNEGISLGKAGEMDRSPGRDRVGKCQENQQGMEKKKVSRIRVVVRMNL